MEEVGEWRRWGVEEEEEGGVDGPKCSLSFDAKSIANADTWFTPLMLSVSREEFEEAIPRERRFVLSVPGRLNTSETTSVCMDLKEAYHWLRLNPIASLDCPAGRCPLTETQRRP